MTQSRDEKEFEEWKQTEYKAVLDLLSKYKAQDWSSTWPGRTRDSNSRECAARLLRARGLLELLQSTIYSEQHLEIPTDRLADAVAGVSDAVQAALEYAERGFAPVFVEFKWQAKEKKEEESS